MCERFSQTLSHKHFSTPWQRLLFSKSIGWGVAMLRFGGRLHLNPNPHLRSFKGLELAGIKPTSPHTTLPQTTLPQTPYGTERHWDLRTTSCPTLNTLMAASWWASRKLPGDCTPSTRQQRPNVVVREFSSPRSSRPTPSGILSRKLLDRVAHQGDSASSLL